MPKFDPIPMQYATLKIGEHHLHSFSGMTAIWEEIRKFVLFGEITGYFPRVPTAVTFYRGHLTNLRLILESPPKANALILAVIKILGEISGTGVGKFIGALSDVAVQDSNEVQRILKERKYLEFPFKNIRKVMCYQNSIFWAVIEDDPIGMGVPFVPNYIDKEGNDDSGTIFSDSDNHIHEFSNIVSSLLRFEHTDKPIKL